MPHLTWSLLFAAGANRAAVVSKKSSRSRDRNGLPIPPFPMRPREDEPNQQERKGKTNMQNQVANEFEPKHDVEIEETELESIASALRVRTGLKAGLQPCI
jgi:hypothetical protein